MSLILLLKRAFYYQAASGTACGCCCRRCDSFGAFDSAENKHRPFWSTTGVCIASSVSMSTPQNIYTRTQTQTHTRTRNKNRRGMQHPHLNSIRICKLRKHEHDVANDVRGGASVGHYLQQHGRRPVVKAVRQALARLQQLPRDNTPKRGYHRAERRGGGVKTITGGTITIYYINQTPKGGRAYLQTCVLDMQ